MDGFFEKYGRVIIIAVAICFVLLYLTPMRNVVGSSINGFAGNFANKVGESLGTVKMPDGSNNIKREPSSMLMKANSDRNASSFNGNIPSSATKIMFTDEKAPKGVATVDLTAAQDGDVVGWLDGTTWKISTQDSKKSVTFNADSSYMFFDGGTGRIKEIQFNNIDTRQVKSMDNLFIMCKGLTNLDLSSFDTSNVTNMNSMFRSCINLERLDLSSFDTSKVTDMGAIFTDCRGLTNLNLSNFNTSKVENMGYMFCGCSGLTNLDLGNLNTSKVKNMMHMFNGLSVTSLDLSNFDTSNVTDMVSMFFGCTDLTNIDLSSFDTSKVESMGSMFYQCYKLNSIKVRSQTDIDNFKTKGTFLNSSVKFEIA